MALINESDLRELQKKINQTRQGKERIDPSEICWVFWAYCCPHLRRAHRKGNLFQDLSFCEEKQTEHTIAQPMEPDGVSIACTISAAVCTTELRFDEQSRIAPAIYEHMYQNRQAINEILGYSMHFVNANPRKNQPPRITISSTDLEVLQVSDWPKLTEFFVETTLALQKLFDVFFIVC